MEKNMTYAGTGVDYGSMDPFKIAAQKAAMATSKNIRRLGGYEEFQPSRGESAFLIETPIGFIAHVEEGLGTKNLVADAVYSLTGKSFYDQISQDTLAMIVNDMITVGALPISVAMHLAVGDSDWFKDEVRSGDLINGWKKGCDLSRCVWGGGETPTLKGVVVPGTVVLSGSAVGIIRDIDNLIEGVSIRHGDAIVIIQSSGIHANGLTLARKIADKLPKGYLTNLSDGRTYGEALLDPTHIYVGLIEDCQKKGVSIHYAVNITGHGWRKLMRAVQPFRYVIERLPEQLPIFDFIQEHGPVDVKEAYGNLNMGAGFALYVSESDADKVIETAASLGLSAIKAGYIERAEEKSVVIQDFLEFAGETLAVR